MLDKLYTIKQRFKEIDNLLSVEEIAIDHEKAGQLAKERSLLQRTVSMYDELISLNDQIDDTVNMIAEDSDQAFKALAEEELSSLMERKTDIESRLKIALIPKDTNDDRNVIVEIRAGTGGDEAALFAGDLFRMYSRYAQTKGSAIDLIDSNATGIGGFKEVIFEVSGNSPFSYLKYERGGHRVQRVPVTETQGRLHTSLVTVAIMPTVETVEIDIDTNDLRIDIFHASGHGGQSVQKVATAVRIIHIPTGIVSTCQDERSQLKNKQRAMSVLRARIMDMEVSKQQQEQANARRSQVGSGDRSEKIRTYNFPQNRVTDHRVGFTSHNLERILMGDLDEFVDAMATEQQSQSLQND